MASPQSQPRRVAHLLRWQLPDRSDVAIELRQVTVQRWRTDPRFGDGNWHCLPAVESGQVLLVRMTLHRADIVRA